MCQKIGNTRGGMLVVEMTPAEWAALNPDGNELQSDQVQRVIGTDLGWLNNRTSMALLDFSTGQPVLLDTFQAQSAKPGDNNAWFAQLAGVANQVDRWLQKSLADGKPTGFAFEAVYLDKNTQTTIALATLGGLLAGLARSRGCPVARVYPVQAKLALTGSGKATKAAMKKAAKNLFNKTVDEHTADAIGIGLHGEAMLRQYSFTESGEVITA